MSAIRFAAQQHLAPILRTALKNFAAANAGNLPDNISQLTPFFDPPLDQAILERYKVLSPELRQGWLEGVVLIEKGVIDPARETVFAIGPSVTAYGPSGPVSVPFPPELVPALNAYQADHPRQVPADYDELKPYLTTPAQQTALESFVSLWKKLPTMRTNTVAP